MNTLIFESSMNYWKNHEIVTACGSLVLLKKSIDALEISKEYINNLNDIMGNFGHLLL